MRSVTIALVLFAVTQSEGLFFKLFNKNKGQGTARPSYYPPGEQQRPSYTPPAEWRPFNPNEVRPSYEKPSGSSKKPKRKFPWDILGIFGNKRPKGTSSYRPVYQRPGYQWPSQPSKPSYQGGNSIQRPSYQPGNTKPGYKPGNEHHGNQGNQGFNHESQGFNLGSQGFNQVNQGFNQVNQGFNQVNQGHNQGNQGHNQGNQGHNQGNQGFNQGNQGHNQGNQGFNQGNQGFNNPGHENHGANHGNGDVGFNKGNGNQGFHQGNGNQGFHQANSNQGNNHHGHGNQESTHGNGNTGFNFGTPRPQFNPGHTIACFTPGLRPGYLPPPNLIPSPRPQIPIVPVSPPPTYFPTLPPGGNIRPPGDGYGSPQAPVVNQPWPTASWPNGNHVNFPSALPASTGYGSPQAPVLGQINPPQNNFQVILPPTQSFTNPAITTVQVASVPSGGSTLSTTNSDLPSQNLTIGSSVSPEGSSVAASDTVNATTQLPPAAEPYTGYGSPNGALLSTLGAVNPTEELPLVIDAYSVDEGGEPKAEPSSFGDSWVPMTMSKIMEMFSLPQNPAPDGPQGRGNPDGPVLGSTNLPNPFVINRKNQGGNNNGQIIIQVIKEQFDDVATLEPPYAPLKSERPTTLGSTINTAGALSDVTGTNTLVVVKVSSDSNSVEVQTPNPTFRSTVWNVGNNRTVVEPQVEDEPMTTTPIPLLEAPISDTEEARSGKSIDFHRLGFISDKGTTEKSTNNLHNIDLTTHELLNTIPYSDMEFKPPGTSPPHPMSLSTFVSLTLDEESTTTPATHPKSILDIIDEANESDLEGPAHLGFSIHKDPEQQFGDLVYYDEDFSEHTNDDALNPSKIRDDAFFDLLHSTQGTPAAQTTSWAWTNSKESRQLLASTIPTTETITTTAAVSTSAATTTATSTTPAVATTTPAATTATPAATTATPAITITTADTTVIVMEVNTKEVEEPMTAVSPIPRIDEMSEQNGSENAIEDEAVSEVSKKVLGERSVRAHKTALPQLVEEPTPSPAKLVKQEKPSVPLVWYYPIRGKPFRSFVPSLKISSISGRK